MVAKFIFEKNNERLSKILVTILKIGSKKGQIKVIKDNGKIIKLTKGTKIRL